VAEGGAEVSGRNSGPAHDCHVWGRLLVVRQVESVTSWRSLTKASSAASTTSTDWRGQKLMFGLACNIAGCRREGPPWNCRKRVQILQAFEFIRGNTEMASWRPLVFYECRYT
jgi:hypothetical protein